MKDYVQCFTCGKVTYFQKGMQNADTLNPGRTCLLGGTKKIVNPMHGVQYVYSGQSSMFLV
jgi:hypothetical protein